jgi:hypothetical protein
MNRALSWLWVIGVCVLMPLLASRGVIEIRKAENQYRLKPKN